MSDTPVHGDAETVRDVTREAAVPTELDPTKVYLTHSSRKEILDLERFLPWPRRATGVYTAATVESFIDYAKAHAIEGTTTVWVEPTTGAIVAVLNDHEGGDSERASAWGDHRVKLALTHSDEWLRWKKLDGVLGSQQTFAEHIEESQLDIVSPDAAEVLEIAESFHASVNAKFQSAQRLSSGEVQFAYVEEIDAKAGARGEVAIPKSITVVLAPFLGEDRVPIEALLRYRVRGGELTIGYKLVRPDDVVRHAIDMIAGRLRSTFDRVYLGVPRA